jgi:hypothetical protein
VANKIHETVITPEVGMAFQSEDDAYDMYNTGLCWTEKYVSTIIILLVLISQKTSGPNDVSEVDKKLIGQIQEAGMRPSQVLSS